MSSTMTATFPFTSPIKFITCKIDTFNLELMSWKTQGRQKTWKRKKKKLSLSNRETFLENAEVEPLGYIHNFIVCAD
jgi:hypothetical protein